MSTIFRNQEPLGKQIKMLLLIKVQKEIRTTGMLMATNTRPIKAAHHLKKGQEGYQFVFGPTAWNSRYLSGHATFLLVTFKKIRPVHTYPDIFESAIFFFADSKISTSSRIRMQIEFARPHVSSDTYLDSL